MSVIVSRGRPRRSSPHASYPLPSGRSWTQAGLRSIELLRGDLWATYEALVRSQPWVFSAVTKLTYWSSRVPFKLYDGELSDSRERVYDGELATLLKRPYPRCRWVNFGHDFYWDYYVWGHGLAMKYRRSAGAPPEEVWPVPWRFVETVLDGAGRSLGYKVRIDGEPIGLTPADVVHLQWPRGIPPLEALARTVQVEDAALTYQVEAIRGGIAPRAAFTTDGKLPPSDQERLRLELSKLYGGPEGAGNFAILHDGLKYDRPIGVSPADLLLMEQRKFSREEVASAFDISPPFLGILDRATFNNITELRESMYVDSLGPKLDSMQACLQAQLVDDEPVWRDLGYYVEYDMGAILKPNPEGAARQSLMDQQSSTTTIDERRRLRNEKPFNITGVTDVPLIPANMTPASAFKDGLPPAAQGMQASLSEELVAEAFRAGQHHPPAPNQIDEEQE